MSSCLDRARLVLAVSALLLLAACSPGPGTTEAPGDLGGQSSLLDFSLPDVRGGQVSGGDLAGKDVALWFWAPW